MDPLGLQAAIDGIKQKVEDPLIHSLLDAVPAAFTALRAERMLLQEWGDGALTRVENMVKPFAEFIASVKIQVGK